MINRIFLDLDGVVRDWTRGVADLFRAPELWRHPEMITGWDFVTEYVCGKNGISEKKFWESQDKSFWLGLRKTKEADEIFRLLQATEVSVFLLTSPTLNNAGWSQQWIKEILPSFFYQKRYMIGPCKYVCADPDSMLIDDAEKNIQPWVEHGGVGLLVPRPWNENRHLHTMQHITQTLQQFFSTKVC